MIGLLPVDVYGTVDWVCLVAALILLDVLCERVLRRCAPLVLIAGLLHYVVRGDDLDGSFQYGLEVGLKAASAHLLAAVHAFLYH